MFTQIKCSGADVPAVAAYELTNMIGTKIVQHVWLGRYRMRIEFGKYGLPLVSCRSSPQPSVKIFTFEGYRRHGYIQYNWIRQRKINLIGGNRARCYCINYLQKSLRSKHTTSDSLPHPRRKGVMQHHIFMAIPKNN